MDTALGSGNDKYNFVDFDGTVTTGRNDHITVREVLHYDRRTR